MNLVLDDAEEVHMKTKNRKPLGKNLITDFFKNYFLKLFRVYLFHFVSFLLSIREGHAERRQHHAATERLDLTSFLGISVDFLER